MRLLRVGCALECKFCSTAQQGFNRNLRVSEIIGRVWRAAKIVGAVKTTGVRPITNVVMMGMGEPLLNLNNVVPAMEIMLDDFGFGLSKRRVTLSTSGVVPALDKLGDMIDVALAISCTRRTTPFVTKSSRSTKSTTSRPSSTRCAAIFRSPTPTGAG